MHKKHEKPGISDQGERNAYTLLAYLPTYLAVPQVAVQGAAAFRLAQADRRVVSESGERNDTGQEKVDSIAGRGWTRCRKEASRQKYLKDASKRQKVSSTHLTASQSVLHSP